MNTSRHSRLVYLALAALAAAALIGCAAEPNDFPPRPTNTPTSDVVVSTVAPGPTPTPPGLSAGPTTTTVPLPVPTGVYTPTPEGGVTVSTVEPPAPPTHSVSGGQGLPSPTSQDGGGNGPRDITMADNNQTVTIAVGQMIQVKLNPDLVWEFTLSDPDVLSPVETFVAVPGVQQIYSGAKPGQTTLTANGKANCKPGEACPMFIILFRVTIVVR